MMLGPQFRALARHTLGGCGNPSTCNPGRPPALSQACTRSLPESTRAHPDHRTHDDMSATHARKGKTVGHARAGTHARTQARAHTSMRASMQTCSPHASNNSADTRALMLDALTA
jgi:hypothetical protein